MILEMLLLLDLQSTCTLFARPQISTDYIQTFAGPEEIRVSPARCASAGRFDRLWVVVPRHGDISVLTASKGSRGNIRIPPSGRPSSPNWRTGGNCVSED
jgi:hypothetical protein